MTVFKRGLSPQFIGALGVLAKTDCWWKDVLADPTLLIGIRDEALDVYWHGQALFCATYSGSVRVNTHVKYLLDPDRSDRVPLKEDGSMAVAEPMIKCYKDQETLEKMKRAAGLFAGDEKRGVHAIALANKDVIDVEIQLDARALLLKRKEPRIDIAALEKTENGIELVFWEAKIFANKELRAKGDSKPDVVKQIEEYRKVLDHHRQSVISSYIRVAENLVAIVAMNNQARSVGAAIQAVAGGITPTLGAPPRVGLVVFGFDADEKADESIGAKHFEKLKAEVGPKLVRTRGDAKGWKL